MPEAQGINLKSPWLDFGQRGVFAGLKSLDGSGPGTLWRDTRSSPISPTPEEPFALFPQLILASQSLFSASRFVRADPRYPVTPSVSLTKGTQF